VIVSALTIPDMWTLLEHHGLRVIPVDVDPATLAPTAADIERLVTPATRAVLVAHLFGTRSGLDDIVRVAREHGLLLWEDRAQTFDSPTPHGDARADCSMLSFGPIKTATALGGGALIFSDASLAAKIRATHAAYPRARRRATSLCVRSRSHGRACARCLVTPPRTTTTGCSRCWATSRRR
jgi:dTDP-4-amino-4,6-dideoxygalactose transaminase